MDVHHMQIQCQIFQHPNEIHLGLMMLYIHLSNTVRIILNIIIIIIFIIEYYMVNIKKKAFFKSINYFTIVIEIIFFKYYFIYIFKEEH